MTPLQAEQSGANSVIRRLQDDDSLFRNYLILGAITIGFLVLLTVCCCFLQAYCKHYFGINFCPGSGHVNPRAARLARIRAYEDEQAAIELQRQFQEEARQQTIEEKRRERREKYKGLLKDNIMVVAENDLVHDVRGLDPPGPTDIEIGETAENEACRRPSEMIQLTLPVNGSDGKPRVASGHCAVCIAEYEPGDEVVWSTSERCQHVFHDDCILMWLSKGKKRCPICRYVFVPSSSTVDNNKDLGGDEQEDEASESVQPPHLEDGQQDISNDDVSTSEQADESAR